MRPGRDEQCRTTRRARLRRIGGLLLALLPFGGVGCLTFLALPDSDSALDVLGDLVLDPKIGCEALAVVFDVQDFPIVDDPGQVGIPFDETFIPADDGVALKVWRLKSDIDYGTIVLSNGAVGQLPCYLLVARILYNAGFSVVMYDYRGFGGSGGEPSLKALHGDLNTVVNWALDASGESQVILAGVSLGAIPSVSVAAERPDDVALVVLDSPVALGEEIKRFAFFTGGRPSAFEALLPKELITEDEISELTMPSLLFLNELDVITTPGQTLKLFELAGGSPELVKLPGIGHASGPYHLEVVYRYFLNDFLERNYIVPRYGRIQETFGPSEEPNFADLPG
ncbi:MAG: alpha/beta fold hydrolase [Phycisphaerales bacterium]|nr:alpha/beta fold hydrolase [Phycisphaerales bacterium]